MTEHISTQKVNRAWWGTVTIFLVHGLIVATWVSRIPAVQSALKLNNGVLGLTLLSSATGAVCTIPFAGYLVSRYGSKRVTSVSSALFAATLVLPGVAFNAATLAVALFVFGATAASMDVSMNAQGVQVEKHLGARTMSRFHGMFSLGGMVGAGIGGWIAARGVTPAVHFGLSSAVYLAIIAATFPLLLSSHAETSHSEHRLPLNKIPRVLLALSAIGFCILLSEGAMADWTAVYLRQVLKAGPGIAAAGYAVFSAAMAIFRFLGDLITTRLGPLLTVRAGSLLGATGLLWALCMHSPAWALPGFAATGAGFSVIIPLVFGSGGRVESVNPGAGIATVTGIGYIGFIVGPPAIGFASQLFTLRYALGVVVACCLISALLARFMASGHSRSFRDNQLRAPAANESGPCR
jgi:MFS family permease